MHCPEHLVIDLRWCRVWHIQSADVRREYVSWREVLNPLRYEINLGYPGRNVAINEDARFNRAFQTGLFRFLKGCWWRGHKPHASRFTGRVICDNCMKVLK